MLEPYAPSMGRPVEGALAYIPGWKDSTNRPQQLVIAAPRGIYAGPQGIFIGAFCWVDPETGIALNSKPDTPALIAIAVLLADAYPVLYKKNGRLSVKPGSTFYPFNKGFIWMRFPGGARQNDVVYADNATGTAITGSAATSSSSASPFSVYTPCKPGGLSMVEAF